jgi:hypothetical protein
VLLDPDRVVDPIELDGLAERRVNNAGVAFDGRLHATDILEAVEGPDDFAGRRLGEKRSRLAYHEHGEHGPCCIPENHVHLLCWCPKS